MYSQTGKNVKQSESFIWCLLLIFNIVYRDHLTSLHMGFHTKRAAAGLGTSGLTHKYKEKGGIHYM